MKAGPCILIADRNRRIREFLQRELLADGYRVQLARDGEEVLSIIDGLDPPDLLVLDLEIPYGGGVPVLEKIHARIPPVPVVIHTFITEDLRGAIDTGQVKAVVEKSENIDKLKHAIRELLQRYYPERFPPDEGEQ